MSPLSKVILCMVMIRGRHRGLPPFQLPYLAQILSLTIRIRVQVSQWLSTEQSCSRTNSETRRRPRMQRTMKSQRGPGTATHFHERERVLRRATRFREPVPVQELARGMASSCAGARLLFQSIELREFSVVHVFRSWFRSWRVGRSIDFCINCRKETHRRCGAMHAVLDY